LAVGLRGGVAELGVIDDADDEARYADAVAGQHVADDD
jgi:hypothetical protein